MADFMRGIDAEPSADVQLLLTNKTTQPGPVITQQQQQLLAQNR